MAMRKYVVIVVIMLILMGILAVLAINRALAPGV